MTLFARKHVITVKNKYENLEHVVDSKFNTLKEAPVSIGEENSKKKKKNDR